MATLSKRLDNLTTFVNQRISELLHQLTARLITILTYEERVILCDFLFHGESSETLESVLEKLETDEEFRKTLREVIRLMRARAGIPLE